MPFDSFNLKAEDLTMSPLTPSRSAPAPPYRLSDRPTMFRSITSKASIRNLSRKASTKSLSRKASKPALGEKPTLEQLYSHQIGISTVRTTAPHGTAATGVATDVTLKKRMAGIWGTVSSYFIKASLTDDVLSAHNRYLPVTRGCVF